MKDKNGNPHYAYVEETLFCSTPKHYDYLYLYIGNAPDCDKAIVEVTGITTQLFTKENEDLRPDSLSRNHCGMFMARTKMAMI